MLAKQYNKRFLTWASRLGPGNLVLTACGLGLLSLSLGCSICPSPYDYDYGTYGTKTPRSDMRNGRVGSVFSDPALTGQSSEVVAGEHVQGTYLPGSYLPGDGFGVTDGVVGEYEWSTEAVPVVPGETVHGQIIIE